jgi:hypothetical protein
MADMMITMNLGTTTVMIMSHRARILKYDVADPFDERKALSATPPLMFVVATTPRESPVMKGRGEDNL